MTEFPDSFTSLFDIYLSSSFFDSNGSWQRAGPYQLTVRLRPVAGGVTVEQSGAGPVSRDRGDKCCWSLAGSHSPGHLHTTNNNERNCPHPGWPMWQPNWSQSKFFFLIILDVRRFFWNSNFFPCVMQSILNRNIKSSNVS